MSVLRSEGARQAPEGVVVAEVTDLPLDGSHLLRQLGGVSDGAVVVFEGRVRDHNAGRTVARLRYDAYREMANETLHDIAQEAIRLTGASAIGVRHRVGVLDPPSVSLVIAVAAAHRRPAFEASTYVIEEIKRRLPLWKKEEYADGTSQWLGGQVPPGGVGPDESEIDGGQG